MTTRVQSNHPEDIVQPVSHRQFTSHAEAMAYLQSVGAQYQADSSYEPHRRQIFYAPRLGGHAWISIERQNNVIVALFYPECPCGFAAGAHIVVPKAGS